MYSEYIVSSLKEVGFYFFNQYENDIDKESRQLLSITFKAQQELSVDADTRQGSTLSKVLVDKEIKGFVIVPSNRFTKAQRINQLNVLCDALKNGYMDCANKDFLAVFGYGIRKKPIVWTEDINLLKYLINRLITKGVISKKNKWKITVSCFKLTDAELMTEQFRSNTLIPTQRGFIDNMTSHL